MTAQIAASDDGVVQKRKDQPYGRMFADPGADSGIHSLYWVLQGSIELRQAPFILWITDLSAPDPYYVLPVIMAATMILQTRLNPTPPDPIQAKVMMIMPVVFSVFFFFFPAGLGAVLAGE